MAPALAFLALYPMVFVPGPKLLATLTSIVGGLLSFASVAFSAARAHTERRRWAQRMAAVGSVFFRSAVAMAVTLVLDGARERLVEGFALGPLLDYLLRAGRRGG